MGYTLCVHVLCYRCTWAAHYLYMCYVIGVYWLHTIAVSTLGPEPGSNPVDPRPHLNPVSSTQVQPGSS